MINSLDKPISNNPNGAINTNISQETNQNSNFLEKRILRFKVILIGDASVGKTSILQRFIHNKFKMEYNCTIGVDYWVKSLTIDNDNTVDLQIWDTCGQERYKTITRQYYRDTHGKITLYKGCLLVFDLTKKETFKNIEVWLEDTRNFGNQEMIMLIVGNKSDLVDIREVSKEEIEELTKKYNYNYLEVSALTGDNVKNCFETIAGNMLSNEIELSHNRSKLKQKFKSDNRNVTVNKSVELTKKSYKPESNNCC